MRNNIKIVLDKSFTMREKLSVVQIPTWRNSYNQCQRLGACVFEACFTRCHLQEIVYVAETLDSVSGCVVQIVRNQVQHSCRGGLIRSCVISWFALRSSRRGVIRPAILGIRIQWLPCWLACSIIVSALTFVSGIHFTSHWWLVNRH